MKRSWGLRACENPDCYRRVWQRDINAACAFMVLYARWACLLPLVMPAHALAVGDWRSIVTHTAAV